MAVLIASNLDKDIAGRPLLRAVSLKLERRDRLTVAGRNGSGKTTLLRMLAGETSLDGGELVLAKDARVALHDQRPPRELGVTLRDYVLSGAAELVALEQRLTELEQAMADGAHDEAALADYAAVQARLEHAGGYRWRDRVTAAVRGLGFEEESLDRELHSFSGGELTRASLARALAGDPDLLLLDEPTNHLDIASLEWLERTLTGLDAAIVLVAHDRWFLEAVGTAVLELADGRSRYFKGSWHAWRKERAAREHAAGRAAERQQAEIARLERFVERFRAGTRARQAQARQKRLDRIDRVDPGAGSNGAAIALAFAKPERSGRVIFELEDARLEVPGRTLLEGVELWLERGEHVSLVGPNGAGKTTLIETLAGDRELPAGKLRRGHNVKLGLLSQHAEELGAGSTVLEATQRATGLTPNKARALLGRFLFSGEQAEKPVDGLSGGERRRLSLAILVSSSANVLILDEPTNHLDVESREALEDALLAFEGSLLLVSHDRALLAAVGTRTIAIEDRSLRSYAGGFAEYVRAREAAKAAHEAGSRERAGARAAARKGGGRSGGQAARASASKRERAAERERASLEAEVERAERALAAIEDELSDPAAWSDPEQAARAGARHDAARQKVRQLYARWEQSVS
jgi:ATP-binding cassette subfamily F protein 3